MRLPNEMDNCPLVLNNIEDLSPCSPKPNNRQNIHNTREQAMLGSRSLGARTACAYLCIWFAWRLTWFWNRYRVGPPFLYILLKNI